MQIPVSEYAGIALPLGFYARQPSEASLAEVCSHKAFAEPGKLPQASRQAYRNLSEAAAKGVNP